MSNILKGLNENRSSWDSNMPGYQGDYGGAENWGRRNKASDENDAIDARLRQQYAQRQEYERSGQFWLKLKDTQRHLPAGPFVGKQAANKAALDLLKQQPELKGNLLITAYGPDEKQGVAEGPAFDKWANERVASQLHKLIAPEIKGKIQNIVSRLSDEYGMWDHKAQTFTPDGLEHLKSILKFNDNYIRYALSLTSKDFEAEGVEEGQIYSGGNKQAGMKWYKPRSVPNQNELNKESAIMKGLQLEGNDEEHHTGGTLGTPYPGTYEQETLPYRTKGQKRTQSIAFEDKK